MRIWMLGLIALCGSACSSLDRASDRQPSSLSPAACEKLSRLEIHSHRGAWDRPENMMSAFRRGAEQGADFIELGLQMSRDHELVVAHDAFVKAECRFRNGRPLPEQKFYRKMSLAEIRDLDCGSVVKIGQPVPGEGISTLAEVMEALKPLKSARGLPLALNIEIKYNPSQPQFYPSRDFYVQRLLRVLDESGYETSRFMVQSFDAEILRVLSRARPGLRLSPLLSDAADGVRTAKSMGASLVTPHYGQVSPEMLADFHANGIKVVPWTVNTPDVAEKLILWGVDGLITDHPEWFRFAASFCEK